MIYIEHPSLDASFYFAMEDYFLATTECPIFLLWQTTPTIMLGRYQNIYQELKPSVIHNPEITLVRRRTGGGTIFTDEGGFQFSFITKANQKQIDFHTFMDPIVSALNELGAEVEYNSRNDLAIAGKKVSGNAQCVQNQRVLHHGSLLFDTSGATLDAYLRLPKYKMQSKGIRSVHQRTTTLRPHLNEEMTASQFKEVLLQRLPITECRVLTSEEEQAIQKIRQERYQNPSWTWDKNPKFQLQRSQTFPGGHFVASLEVKEGKIVDLYLQGDFFATGDVSLWLNYFKNQRFTKEAIAEVLRLHPASAMIYQLSNEEFMQLLFADEDEE